MHAAIAAEMQAEDDAMQASAVVRFGTGARDPIGTSTGSGFGDSSFANLFTRVQAQASAMLLVR